MLLVCCTYTAFIDVYVCTLSEHVHTCLYTYKALQICIYYVHTYVYKYLFEPTCMYMLYTVV